MRLGWIVRVAFVVAATLVSFSASRVEAASPPDCFHCHDRAAFRKKVTHRPVAEGKCAACHNSHAAKYKGLLRRKVKALCYSCHKEAATSHGQGIVHEPVAKGECLACHDPHASDRKALLKKKDSELCFACHSDLPQKAPHTHAPFASGECASCHRAHQSPNTALLVEPPATLCRSCHDAGEIQKKHPNFPEEVRNCASCHSPHGSNRKGLIRNVLHEPYSSGCNDCHTTKGAPVTIETCLQCHEGVGEKMASSHNHLVRYGNNGCLACHSPHAADGPRLLKDKERAVCRTCHEGTFRRNEGAKWKHKKTDSCTDCHAPHGSNHPAMAKGPINSVCATCHKKHAEFTHPIGEKVFDPRTGQMLTCASCHRTKGSDHESHLRYDGHRDLCLQCHKDI